MFILLLSFVAFFGFLLCTVINAMTFLGMDFIWLSICLLVGSMLLMLPGLVVFPASLPPCDRSFRANYNFWRKIPKIWRGILGFLFGYVVITFVMGMFFSNGTTIIPPYGSRIATAMAMSLFSFFTIAYWYHSPLEQRKHWLTFLHPKKHTKRHLSKHNLE
jgi:hypothetical protein